MSSIYISRKKAEKFAEDIESAIQNPSENPLLHYAYGIGGIGKTSLLKQIITSCQSKYQCAYCSFDSKSHGEKSSIATAIELLKKLDEKLPKGDGWEGNPFRETYSKWQKAIRDLEKEANKEKSEEKKKNTLDLVKQISGLAKQVTSVVGAVVTNGNETAAKAGGFLAEKGIDSLAQGVSSVVEIQDLIKKSKTAKDKPELQELLTNPLKELTKAFVKTIVNKSQNKPVVLFIDTYEKASPDFDTFFCELILPEAKLRNAPVRIVMAGRYSLSSSIYQRLFQQYMGNTSVETKLDKFTEKETTSYLKQIGIERQEDIKKIWRATKGYPYYLNLIRDQKQQGNEVKLHRGGRDIVDLLLQGLNETEKKVVALAAYCRWFDQQIIDYLLQKNDISEAPQNCSSWFNWLIELDFVIESKHYSLDDVARDIIRQTEHKDKKDKFKTTHQQLADYFQQRADAEVVDEEFLEEKYEYPEWREYITESVYHSLYASKKQGQAKLLTYFFEGAYFKNPEIAINSYSAVVAESDLEDRELNLLPGNTKPFLMSVSLAIAFGWELIDKNPKKYQIGFKVEGETENINLGKAFQQQVESSLDKCFKKVSELSGIAKCWGMLGIYYRSDSLTKALRVLEENRKEIETLELMRYKKLCFKIHLFHGGTLFDLKRHEEAIESYDKAIDIYPQSYKALVNRGSPFGNIEKYKEAIESYNKAIEIYKNDDAAWIGRGAALYDLGKYKEAVESYDRAIELNSENSITFGKRGDSLSMLEKYELAVESYDRAIELDPKSDYVWGNKGSTLSNSAKYKEAIESYDKALDINPKNDYVWARRGAVLYDIGKYKSAIENYDKALDINPKNDYALAMRGAALCNIGKYEEAINSYDKALDINPINSIAHNMKALSMSMNGDLKSSLTNIEQAIQLVPDNVIYTANKGIILARQGNYPEALKYCNLAIEKDNNHESGYYAKACYFALQGDDTQAIEFLGKAIEISPHNSRREAKINPDFDRLRDNPAFKALVEGT